MFKNLKGNRRINSANLTHVTSSILKNNMLAQNPIIVNEKMQIIDGQHRFEVAKANNLEVYYIVLENADLPDVQMLNANTKPWNMTDYLESYISIGKADYIKLKEFCIEYDMPISLSIMLLSGKIQPKASQENLQKFREGNFIVADESFARDIADKVMDFKPFMVPGLWRNREIIYALNQIESKIDHKELLNKVAETGWTMNRQANLKNYLRMLEDMYNYKKHAKARLF